MMVSIKALESDCENESVTVTVKLKFPVLVGMPEMVPVGLRVRPGGSAP